MNENITWEEIEAVPSPCRPQSIIAAKIVRRQAQCRPCKLTVSIASNGSVKVTGTADEALRDDVRHAVEQVVARGVDAVLGITWPWPIRAEDVVVKTKLTF